MSILLVDPHNGRLFADVPELAFLLALETNPQQTRYGWRAEKARIFFERTLRPCRSAALGTLTPTEAVLYCLDEIGALDMHRVAALSGLSIPQAVEQLGDRIFREPGTATYVLADAYLSGNVRAKLREAVRGPNGTPLTPAMSPPLKPSSPRRSAPATSSSTSIATGSPTTS